MNKQRRIFLCEHSSTPGQQQCPGVTLASLNIDQDHIIKHSRHKQHPSPAAYLQGDVIDLDIVSAPLAKELDLRGLSHGWGSLPLSH